MDHASAQAWLDRYLAAWASYEPEAIADLFAPDVRYRYHPHDAPDGPVVRTYENSFVIRFDEGGRCRELTEYYVQVPDGRA